MSVSKLASAAPSWIIRYLASRNMVASYPVQQSSKYLEAQQRAPSRAYPRSQSVAPKRPKTPPTLLRKSQ